MKFILNKFNLTGAASIIMVFFLWGCVVSAASLDDAFTPGGPLDIASQGAGYDVGVEDPAVLISYYIQAVLSLVGVVFLVLMIYGGFLWMTAKGNEQQVEKSKNLITAAVIGVVIVVSAYAITYFVTKMTAESALEETTPAAPAVTP